MNPIDKRNLFIIVLCRFTSLTGSEILSISIPLYILEVTGSGMMMGLFYFAGLIPSIIVAPFAGIIGDRFNKKNIIVASDIVGSMLLFALLYLLFIGKFSFTVLLVIEVLLASISCIFATSTTSIFNDLFGKELLTKTNAVKNVSGNVSRILGPILGSLLYFLYGIKAVVLINALTFLISGILQLLVVYVRVEAAASQKNMNIKEDLLEIIQFLKIEKSLHAVLLFITILNFFEIPIVSVGFPFMFKSVLAFSDQQYGMLISALSFGMFIGNSILAVFTKRLEKEKNLKLFLVLENMIFVLVSILTIPTIISSFGNSKSAYFIVFAALLFINGIFYSMSGTILVTNLLKVVPTALMTRFASFLHIIFKAIAPIGVLVLGALFDIIPPFAAFISFTVLLLLVVVIYVSSRNTKTVVYPSTEATN